MLSVSRLLILTSSNGLFGFAYNVPISHLCRLVLDSVLVDASLPWSP